MTITHLHLKFIDHLVRIESDSPDYLRLFEQMYGRFTLPPPFDAPPDLTCTVFTQSNNRWGQPVMILGEQVHRLNNPALLKAFIYDGVLNVMMAQVRSHFLIHAGVVAQNGQAGLIVADSGHGKTTLTLALVQKGFRFLSDEVAPVSRPQAAQPTEVLPFPRRLRVRAGTLKLAGFPPPSKPTIWMGKALLDIEHLKPGSLGETAALKHIFFLHNPAAPEPTPLSERTFGVLVDHLPPALLTAARQLSDLETAFADTERGYPTLRLRTYERPQRMPVLAQIESLCHTHGVLVLDISKRPERLASFNGPARLEPLAHSEAVVALLQQFQGGHHSALLTEEFGGSSARLFMALAQSISGATCHRLHLGPLPEMTRLVSSVFAASA